MNNVEDDVKLIREELSSLKTRLDSFSQRFDNHRHTGTDNSNELGGVGELKGSSITLSGGQKIIGSENLIKDTISIVDNNNVEQSLRRSGSLAYQTLNKGNPTETCNLVLGAGRVFIESASQYDFRYFNQTQLQLQHLTNPVDGSIPNNITTSFFFAVRTPVIFRTSSFGFSPIGSITNGGNTLTDLTISGLQPDSAIGAYIQILDKDDNIIESRRIASNTSTVFTIEGTWSIAATGKYWYKVSAQPLLGSADYPWGRVYVNNIGDSKAIRLGVGSSGGSQPIWICFGPGDPNNVVNANPGSIYLRTDNAPGTALYIKQNFSFVDAQQGGSILLPYTGTLSAEGDLSTWPKSGSFVMSDNAGVRYTFTYTNILFSAPFWYFQISGSTGSGIKTFDNNTPIISYPWVAK